MKRMWIVVLLVAVLAVVAAAWLMNRREAQRPPSAVDRLVGSVQKFLAGGVSLVGDGWKVTAGG